MNEEKRQILEMVGEGKISQEDALRLLEALEDDPVDRAFDEAMSQLREDQGKAGPEPPPPEPPIEPTVRPRQEGIWSEVEDAAREVGQVLSQTAAVAMDAVSEGMQWAKGAVQKIPGVSPWWEGGTDAPEGYSQPQEPVEVEKIEIQWVNGPVEIVPWEGNYVNVTEYAQRPLQEGQQLEMAVTEGGTMRIRWTRDKGFFKGLGLSKYLLVQVPAGMELEKVKAANVSGSLQAQGLRAEKWDLSTTSGRVEAAGIRAEKLKLASVSGVVHAENVQCEELRLNTTSGRIEAPGFGSEHAKMTSVSGAVEAYGNGERLEAKTVSGSILLQTEQPPESVRLETMSGRISLVLPPNDGFTAQYESMSGAFASGFPVTGTLGEKTGKAVYGDGEMEISLNTMSGKMEIRPQE